MTHAASSATPASTPSWYRWIPRIAIAACVLIPCLDLRARGLDGSLVKSIGQLLQSNTMTALAFVLTGLSLWLSGNPWPRGQAIARAACRFLAFLVVLVAISRLAEYWPGWTTSIDLALFRGKLPGNRLAPNTAFSFLLEGLALVLVGAKTRYGRQAAMALAAIAASISLIALAGSLYRIAPSFSEAGPFTAMAVKPAAAFLALALGILIAAIPAADLDGFFQKWPVQRTATGGFALGLVLLCTIVTATRQRMQVFVQAIGSDKVTTETIEAAQRLQVTLLEAETTQRGFIITGDKHYLKPYLACVNAIHEELATLQKLTSTTPAQQSRVHDLEPLVAARLSLLQRAIALRPKGLKAALSVIVTGEIEPDADPIRRLLSDMKTEGTALIEQRQTEQCTSAARIVSTSDLGSVLSLVLIALSGFLVRQGIVARQSVENALRRSKEDCQAAQDKADNQAKILKCVLDTIDNGVLVADQDGRIVISNPNANRLTGEVPENLPVDLWSDKYGWFFADGIAPFPSEQLPLSRALRGEETNKVEIFVRNVFVPDGLHISVTGRPLRRADGKCAGGVVVFHDISHQVWAKTELQEARDAVTRAGRANGEFIGRISREIRIPVNGIMENLDSLLGSSLTPEQQNSGQLARSSGESLEALLSDLVDLSRIKAGTLKLESLDFDVRKVVEDVVESFSQQAARQGLEMASHVQPSVPPQVRGDPDRLRQILGNLVRNALACTETGGIAVRVSLAEQTRYETQIRISVSDTGVGIPNHRMEQLFDPFARNDAATTGADPGTGLGLAIARQLTELMGGHIDVESKVGKGSSFSFTARLQKQGRHEDAPVVAQPGALRILAVDYNPTSREILRQQIASSGMHAAVARDGERALKILAKAAASSTPVDVAIIDSEIPGMDGFELGKAIKADPTLSHTVLILLLPVGAEFDPSRLQETGFTRHITKPIRQSQLLDTIMDAVTAPPPQPTGAEAASEEAADVAAMAEAQAILPAELGGDNSSVPPIAQPAPAPEASTPAPARPRPLAGGAGPSIWETLAQDGTPPFDVEALYERCLGSITILYQSFSDFEAQASTDIERLKLSFRKSDTVACANIAHALKRAAGIVSAETMIQMASEVEKISRDRELENAAESVKRLCEEVQRCMEFIPAVKDKMSAKVF